MSPRTLLLWLAALALALLILYRARRGRRTLLRSPAPPRLVRMLAVLLVLFGWGRAIAAPPEAGSGSCATLPAPAPVPAPSERRVLDAPAGERGLSAPIPHQAAARLIAAHHAPDAPWVGIKRLLVVGSEIPELAWRDLAWTSAEDLPAAGPTLAALAALDAGPASAPPTPGQVAELLEAAAAGYLFDAYLTAWAFGALSTAVAAARTRPSPALERDLSRALTWAERHARLHDARVRAAGATHPLEHRPWMGKSMRPQGFVEHVVPATFHEALERALAEATAGTWETESALSLTVVGAPTGATLIRRGHRLPLSPGASFHFRRLDLVEVPAGTSAAVLRHPVLGELRLPSGSLTASWHLPDRLTDSARAAVDDLVSRAARCDEGALALLRHTVPAAHAGLRATLEREPRAPGAPAMRMILALYDR